jgi:hypothetical protein
MAVPIRVGQRWRRRVELRDGFDELVVTGKVQITESSHEWALRPVSGGLDVVAATGASLETAFTLISEPDASATAVDFAEWCDE